MARPKLPPEKCRSKQVAVRLRPDDYEVIVRKAGECRLPVATYIRRVAVQAARNLKHN